MTTYVTDPFTDTAGVDLPSHSPSLGGPWVYHPNNTALFCITNANRVRQNLNGTALAYATGTPASADYDVSAVLRKLSGGLGSASSMGIAGRSSTSVFTQYYLSYNDGAAQWQLGKVVSSANTVLGSFAQGLTLNQDYAIVLRMVGTAISGYLDGVLLIGPITDASIAVAGKGMIRASGNLPVSSDTTGYHLDNFSVDSIPVVASSYKDSGNVGADGLWVPNRRETRIMVPE
jgi:hypothetical protein